MLACLKRAGFTIIQQRCRVQGREQQSSSLLPPFLYRRVRVSMCLLLSASGEKQAYVASHLA